MREIVFGSSAAFDDTSLPQFVERLGNASFVPIGGLLEQFEGEGPADHACKPGQFVRSRRKLCEPRCDDGVHARALQSGAHALHDEQRITARGAEDLPRFALSSGSADSRRASSAVSSRIERLQRNLQDNARLPQPGQQTG